MRSEFGVEEEEIIFKRGKAPSEAMSGRATYTTAAAILSTCPLHANSGSGKEWRILIGPWLAAKAALVRNYLEVYWPCAVELSAVNAIGTQLRDPINSGLTRWRMAVSNK